MILRGAPVKKHPVAPAQLCRPLYLSPQDSLDQKEERDEEQGDEKDKEDEDEEEEEQEKEPCVRMSGRVRSMPKCLGNM